ncbi:MAG: hypothetical protein WCG47_13895, partial [Dermatophilaceae bacterium]
PRSPTLPTTTPPRRSPRRLHATAPRRHHIRTYEVGVEDETLAGGTGAAASAYVAHHVWHQPYPIQGTVPGGEMHVDHTEQGLLISGATGHLFTNVPATATT